MFLFLMKLTRKRCDLKKKLRVTFVGEAGLDMGGLTKEWFLLLVRQIFHADYGETGFHSSCLCGIQAEFYRTKIMIFESHFIFISL